MKKAITILLFLLFASVLTISIYASKGTSLNHKSSFTGIVNDTNGVPLEGVEVTAKCGGMGNNFYRLVSPNTWTDKNGHFNLSVDFPDISYEVTFRYMYNNDYTMHIIPSETKPLEVQLEIITKQIVRGTVVIGPDSTPVPDATVKYFGEYQKFVLEAKTDNNGQFEFTHLPLSEFQGEIYAQLNDKVSPALRVSYQMNDEPINLELKLDEGAELSGYIKSESKDKPIPDCIVTIKPPYLSGYSLQTTTDVNGLYRFVNVPPSDYKVFAENEDYFMYVQSRVFSDNSKNLKSGQIAQKDLTLRKRMRLEGKVVDPNGKPVSGALIAIDEAHVSENEYSPFVVHTDKNGKFSIATGRIDTSPVQKISGLKGLKKFVTDIFKKRPAGEDAIEAFDSEAGYGKIKFSPYREGRVVKGVKIKLNGMMGLHGKVTDSNGIPLKDIIVNDNTGFNVTSITNGNGEYDLRKIPILWPEKKQGNVYFNAPRPNSTVRFPFQGIIIPYENIESYSKDTGFFHHNQKNHVIKPGKDIEINSALEPTDVITLHGTVSGLNNNPLANSQLVLFRGNADPNEWFRSLAISGNGTKYSAVNTLRSLMIHMIWLDENGFWKIYLARENTSDLHNFINFNLDPNLFSIGVYKNENEHTLIQDVIIKPDEIEKEINIKLEKSELPQTNRDSGVFIRN